MLMFRISSASGSSRYFWIALCSGRAPNWLSYPLSATNALASGDSSKENPSPFSLAITPFIRISMISKISSFVRELKITTSSILFKNSGLNVRFNAFSITALLFSSECSMRVAVAKPTPSPKSFNWRTPILEVMMIMVFLKSTFLPRPSVSWPSSNTCNKIL
eukprot:Mycagemm_TRINITY_DN10695_c0_g1::TRINITY_DN10695_c0_g1_i1::g.4963::m.4963 type:complete len:162 gc:universal TRINITY_DN10695_c0_g1_i1:1128-643(-)